MDNQLLRAGALAAAVLVGQAAQASECARLTRSFVFCEAGTEWESATWEQSGDGATVHLGDLTFGFTDHWMTQADHPTLDGALTALLDEQMVDAEQIYHTRDDFAAGVLTIARSIKTITREDEQPLLEAIMIAETKGKRILLSLNAPVTTPLDDMERRSREIAGLVRLGMEG